MYAGEPMTAPLLVSFGSRSPERSQAAMPKSSTFTIGATSAPCFARNTFDGLRSRWMMPRPCASASPSHASAHHENASRYETRPFSSMRRSRSVPSRYSSARHGSASFEVADVDELSDVRALQLHEHAGLAGEALDDVSARPPHRMEHLDRDALISVVACLEDRSGRTGSELAHDAPSAGDDRAGADLEADRRRARASEAEVAPSRSSRAICLASRSSASIWRGVIVRGLRSATDSAPTDEPSSMRSGTPA